MTVFFSDEGKFGILFGNQGLESGGRVERPRNQGVQHAMSSSDVVAGLSQKNISFFDLLTSIMEIQFSFSSSTCPQY